MPISVRKVGGKKPWAVVNTDTHKIHGRHKTPAEAYAQISAMKHNGVDISGKSEKKGK